MEDTPDTALPGAATQVLDYWLGDALQLGWPSQSRHVLWFGGGKAQDDAITQQFGPWVEQALAGGLTHWEATPMGCLALVIVLDQFTRNVFRGQGRAFSGDARARLLVRDTLQRGWDTQLPCAGAVFLYMPLMHAEDLALQEESVRRFQNLLAGAAPEHKQDLQGNVKFAIEHRDIIGRFGRFPYRNRVLGRPSSADELVFLQDGPRFGQ